VNCPVYKQFCPCEWPSEVLCTRVGRWCLLAELIAVIDRFNGTCRRGLPRDLSPALLFPSACVWRAGRGWGRSGGVSVF